MTTRSPSVRPNLPDITPGEPPQGSAATPPVPAGPPPGAAAYGLVRAAVADRPLEELAELITLLEQYPACAEAAVDALRAAGTERSVEDVTRLVTLLTRPPRAAEGADEVIRAAAERRPVEDVSRLMSLLHRTALEPHCEEEALRTAATRRPVDELAQLIGQLSEEEQNAREAARERLARGETIQPGLGCIDPGNPFAYDGGGGAGEPPESGEGGPTVRGQGFLRTDSPDPAPERGSRRERGFLRSGGAGRSGSSGGSQSSGGFGSSGSSGTEEKAVRRGKGHREYDSGAGYAAVAAGYGPGAGRSPEGLGDGRAGYAPRDRRPERAPADGPDPAAVPRARRSLDRTTRGVARFSALLLIGTGAVCAPPHRQDVPMTAYGVVLGAAAACVLLGLLLAVRPAVLLLLPAVLLPAGLAAIRLLEGRFGTAQLSRALDLTAVPPWLAGALAACAALSALAALLLSAQPNPGR